MVTYLDLFQATFITNFMPIKYNVAVYGTWKNPQATKLS